MLMTSLISTMRSIRCSRTRKTEFRRRRRRQCSRLLAGEQLESRRLLSVDLLHTLHGNATGPQAFARFGTSTATDGKQWVMRNVIRMLAGSGKPLRCFGVTTHGGPKHPLFLSYEAEIVPWEPKIEPASDGWRTR